MKLPGDLIPWEYKFSDDLMLLLLPDLKHIPDSFFLKGGFIKDELDRLKYAAQGLVKSQFHFFYAIIDVAKEEVVGVIWLSFNPIHLYINLHLIYVKPKYQDGKNMERFIDFVKNGLACIGAEYIVTFTDHYRVGKRKGWEVVDSKRLTYFPLKSINR